MKNVSFYYAFNILMKCILKRGCILPKSCEVQIELTSDCVIDLKVLSYITDLYGL